MISSVCFRKIAFGALSALSAVAIAACGDGGSDSGSDDGSYKIGVATAQTGAIAPFDKPAVDGLKVAVDQINDSGGLAGKYEVELDIKDTRSDPSQTVTAAQELVDGGADMLIVPCDGDLALAGGPVGQDAEIPTMSICSSVPILPDEIGDYFFGISYGDNAGSAALASYALDQGYETAYTLNSPDTVYTDKVPTYFEEAFEAGGGQTVGSNSFTIGQQDFGAIVTQIGQISPAPDVIMTSAYEPDFPAFIRQLRGAGIDTPVIGSDGIDTPTVLDLGDAVNGLVHNSSGLPTPGSRLEKFYEDFEADLGKEVESVYSAVGGDIIPVLDAAIKDAGSTDPSGVRDAIASLEDVEGFTGPITYADTNGMPIKQIAIVEVNNGERTLLENTIPEPDEIPAPQE
jgi:branched-chain amino acid transport system substrate-binding protein